MLVSNGRITMRQQCLKPRCVDFRDQYARGGFFRLSVKDKGFSFLITEDSRGTYAIYRMAARSEKGEKFGMYWTDCVAAWTAKPYQLWTKGMCAS